MNDCWNILIPNKNKVAGVNSLKLYDVGLKACLQKPHTIHKMLSKCLGENCMLSGNKHDFFQGKLRWQKQKSEWSLSKLQCELIRWEKWAKYDVMRMKWPSEGLNTRSCDLNEAWGISWRSICFSEILREGWPFCSLQDTIWWGIMMSVNPRRVKFYFQLPTIWGALCKQRPFQLWIPKLYWSLIIICIHKAIHERLLQAMR